MRRLTLILAAAACVGLAAPAFAASIQTATPFASVDNGKSIQDLSAAKKKKAKKVKKARAQTAPAPVTTRSSWGGY